MMVIDKINKINEVIKDIFEFIQSNEMVKNDFSEYLLTIGSSDISLSQMEKIFLPYIFERKLENKSILEMFYESNEGNKDLVQSLLNAISSVFEIKKILKNGFELYNIINEKTYTVLSLTKMSNFRGIYAGQYIVARVFEYDNEYYVIEISNVLSHSQKADAIRYAVMKLVQDSRLLYADNPQKEAFIQDTIKEMYEKFITTFKKDIILTTNKYADEIIGAFNEGDEIDITDKENIISEYKFFHIKELDNNYRNFLENSAGGFASHNEIYDVAVIFDKERGLFAIPFYETFTHILSGEEIDNAKPCIEYFLTNDAIPDIILKRLYNTNPHFIEIINKNMETSYTFEELINKYKTTNISKTQYSSATVLYCSKAFNDIFEIITSPIENTPNYNEKIGRNDVCPCGSGKKYKNCCGAKN